MGRAGRGPTCAPSAPPAGAARARAEGEVGVGCRGADGRARCSPPGPGNTPAASETCLSFPPPGLGLHVSGSRRLYFETFV